MADEELAPSGEPDEVVVSEADEAIEPENNEPTPYDDLAKEYGWRPKEEWDGEGEWRDSQTFLKFGLDKSREVSRDIKELRSTVDSIRAANVIAAKEAAERARNDEAAKWRNIHRQAVEEGDTETAEKAVENIAKVAQPQVDPSVNQWRTENSWFDTDPIAQAVAQAAAQTVVNRGGNVTEQLDAAKKAVHQRFPEYAPKKDTKVVDVAKSSPTARPPKRSSGFHDMPKENQEACRALKDAGLLKDTDGYVRNYFNKEGTVE